MTTPSHQVHRQQAKACIACGVITVSDTRTEDTDKSGQLIKQLLQDAGHATQAYHIIKDEPSQIRPLMEALLARDDVEAVIVNGGTGVARRDVTFDVVSTMVERPLPGFGELFRLLSYEEIGSAAMLSRAMAGAIGNKVVFSMPGSSGAVRLAMEKLVLPEMPHIVYELRK
ncbi:MAG TPA: MogA/MoaB family molybdenum cofactor biosynthesis protein [bacterium]|nr:MogA/MoaB family molybdenum cofactor biosynthesis protein [bacterium]